MISKSVHKESWVDPERLDEYGQPKNKWNSMMMMVRN